MISDIFKKMEEGIKTLKGMIKSAEDLLKIPEKKRLNLFIFKGTKLNVTDNLIKSNIKELKEAVKKIELGKK